MRRRRSVLINGVNRSIGTITQPWIRVEVEAHQRSRRRRSSHRGRLCRGWLRRTWRRTLSGLIGIRLVGIRLGGLSSFSCFALAVSQERSWQGQGNEEEEGEAHGLMRLNARDLEPHLEPKWLRGWHSPR